MKKKLYDLGLRVFPGFLKLISPFHAKAKLMVTGREGWREQLEGLEHTDKRIWFHCASLGEFEQGRPLIEAIKAKYPQHAIIVTFFSPSGYEVRKNYEQADYIGYLPFDGKKTSKEFIEKLKPTMALFIKYEFWYYYLKELKNYQIPTFSVSSIFRPDQQFFKKDGGFFRGMLSSFDRFFVQNMQSKTLLQGIGLNNVTVSGDTRFDRVLEICCQPQQIEQAQVFKNNEMVLVVGSSWPDDMEVLYPIINDPEVKLKFIIAPHEIGKVNISRLCKGLKVSYQLYSNSHLPSLSQSRVLVIDNIGMLSSLYQYGEIAYIGGAFGEGLHNILEAATFGMPILFGKGKENIKYQEAVDLVNRGGAFEVENSDALHNKLNELLEHQDVLKHAATTCHHYVQSQAGATNKIMEHLVQYL